MVSSDFDYIAAMKRLLVIALIVASCSEEQEVMGTWNFSTEAFSGQFTITSDGEGTGTFTIGDHTYTAINSKILEGKSVVLYSEDGAYIGLHQLDFPTSQYQEFREGNLPSPFETQTRQSPLTLTR